MKPTKPQRSKYKSDDEYQVRILEWEVSIGHEKEVRPKGNAMTQKYYYEHFLPVISSKQSRYSRNGPSQ
jgi:hypothetical protein